MGHPQLSEVGIDPPVPLLVPVGQRAASDGTAEAQVVKLVRHRPESGVDVPQTLPVGELGEGHGQIVVATGEAAGLLVPPYRRMHRLRTNRDPRAINCENTICVSRIGHS